MRHSQDQPSTLPILEQSPAYLLLLRWLVRINQRCQPAQKAPDEARSDLSSSTVQSRPSRASKP